MPTSALITPTGIVISMAFCAGGSGVVDRMAIGASGTLVVDTVYSAA
jgi:hypothetical protein